MAEVNLGFLRLDVPQSRDGFFPGVRRTQIDTYAFRTGPVAANVNISASFSRDSISTGIALFRDNNANGTLDDSDTFLPPNSRGSNTFATQNRVLGQGNYIARVQAQTFNDLSYTFQISRSSSGTANPLTTPEILLGTIAKDLRRRNSVSNKDTADNFAFKLDGDSSLNIRVRELGNKKGDANIRVVRDLNSNGIVDRNEVVKRGTSTPNGNLDTITNLKGAGDYILQVCQSQGSTRFAVSFDHSVV
ncbi:hypothetical protein H6F93_00775 [Leptolyngbya sp. FACHB-671]|uniref:hypothetical protein n=1 Tax=Leptolyngbya sp. FACHB-671 TaxID=2692812 RepID=UPI0016825491|nr:hypothetical protein [Leptolyngbya sp. FACHB-671]MBD2066079.1 hypothetical protein [Leptolyngbya sp. FACHB-671]